MYLGVEDPVECANLLNICSLICDELRYGVRIAFSGTRKCNVYLQAADHPLCARQSELLLAILKRAHSVEDGPLDADHEWCNGVPMT